jgi:DNA mismatch repair protein MutL
LLSRAPSGTEFAVARVQLLDDALVNQIAAGEVVERPASVVKELVENALDAGATVIRVAIDNGGKDRIRVVDDGEGMTREDATLAIRRHATSKLRRFEDLSALGTLGFRGEALPSIASVSRFELTTRRREDVAGTQIRVEGGGDPEVRDAGSPPGTTIDIRDLFFNVPARRKFLRARQTERLHVMGVVERAAMAHPKVRFELLHDGRTLRDLLPTSSRYARAKAILSQPLRPIAGEHEGIRLEGGLGPADQARRGMKELYLFVNGRPVVDRALARAIAFAHGDVLGKGRYPSGVLFVELDPAIVDVNAHPQKTEVRFADIRRVTDAVTRIVTEALGTQRWSEEDGTTVRGSAARATTRQPSDGPLAEARLPRDGAFWSQRLRPGPTTAKKAEPKPIVPSPRPTETVAEQAFAAALRERGPAAQVPEPPVEEAPTERYLGALSNGLVLGEAEGSLHVLAPRALWTAHARALLAEEPIPRRRLLFPTRLAVTDTSDATIAAMDALGFDLRVLGDASVAIHAAPRFALPEVPADALARAALERPAEGARAIAEAFGVAAAETDAGRDPAQVWATFLALPTPSRERVSQSLPVDDLGR